MSNDPNQTTPTDETTEADRRDAAASHEPGPVTGEDGTDPSDDAPEGPVKRSVAEAEQESARLGANVKGEGQIS